VVAIRVTKRKGQGKKQGEDEEEQGRWAGMTKPGGKGGGEMSWGTAGLSLGDKRHVLLPQWTSALQEVTGH
jgi:hypothetical protein